MDMDADKAVRERLYGISAETWNIAADIPIVRKDFQTPSFICQERQHVDFNGGKIRHNEFVSFLRHESRADKFREDFRHGVAHHGSLFLCRGRLSIVRFYWGASA